MGPLDDVRILDFSHIAAGPYGTLQLAYFGAEVIKVESRQRPDGWRIRDSASHIEASRPFADHNKNKLGLTLNMKHPLAHTIVDRLLQVCDAVIDNFSVGVMDRLGMGHEQLRTHYPKLVVVSVPGLGSTGPHRHWVTWGPSIMPLSGLTYLWNQEDGPEPVGSQTSYPDYVVGAHVGALVLAAIISRDVTGEGCWIDLSQAEMSATLLAPYYMSVLHGDDDPNPMGNHHSAYAPHGCYPCLGSDRWCVITVTSDAQWIALCRLMERDDWLTDQNLRTFSGRRDHQGALDQQIAAWTLTQDPKIVMEQCQKVGIPAGVVATGEDLTHDPQLEVRKFLIDTQHPYLPGLVMPGCPVDLMDTPAQYTHHAPLLGEHNPDIICGLLGYTRDEYEVFDVAGVFN